MAYYSDEVGFLELFKRVQVCQQRRNFPSINFKPLQMKCLEYLLKGCDVIGVLPTGFGKSMLFHLLPDLIPVKSRKNIVIVICPLNSIVEDQLRVLSAINISAGVIQFAINERKPAEDLFTEGSENRKIHLKETLMDIEQEIVNGNTSIVFAHPEALLKSKGRELMGSKVFQENVVGCVIDEAHCVELWYVIFIIGDCKIVTVNPNRENIYLGKKVRSSDHKKFESYNEILGPVAKELLIKKENYPMTIIYMKLKYCAHAYRLFERILQDEQYVNGCEEPMARLFAQFHSPQTSRMKRELIEEIKKKDSRVRVLFATSALGMGVDAPYVAQVIHISPPNTLESYMQEIGRAGRTGIQSYATLYYNNSDIGSHKKHIQESMKSYCKSREVCLRKQLLEYFGFTTPRQENCCSSEEKSECLLIPSMLIDEYLAERVVMQIEYIELESDLLNNFGIWDEKFIVFTINEQQDISIG
ncbi:ATP-dependent DNA helicase Q1-like [Dendronephthya gigantea]|uniref:ATP-dependent DNA helicase Q1-like n=1 Tax=Dendronephthya gigantea TaxID=151771 RepID=UPI0010695AC4|nr:ATP-dependent DNA helicase Q1-like [Dendronephthya gigantea]